ncbi:sensor histidine kinase [Conexibacter sp. DBS9H8]|uniref:sensor histidine kinase n=1 Tax=Conexibacter sp. DBS9H8 TaxID=2937801 RepID=UPI00200C1957|nr:sensor histidine kinase [Conexibacter sp. DBS9H8]
MSRQTPPGHDDPPRQRAARSLPRPLAPATGWESELEVRAAARRAGVWLGWSSVAAVLIALALGIHAHRRVVVVVLIVGAALLNGSMLVVPHRWWRSRRWSRPLFTVWSGGLLILVALLVLVAGAHADLDLLLFLIVPFLATIHSGSARVAWLAAAIGLLVLLTGASGDFSAGAVALRAVLLLGAAVLAVALADLNRAAAATRIALHDRAELERLLLAEAHHRVKNSLQTVADLLLLSRPAGTGDARAFDETADRIRAIAVVHRLLADRRGADVDAGELLRLITRSVAPDAEVSTVPERLDPDVAQQVGIVANELIANAVEHGLAPIRVALAHGDDPTSLSLTVSDGGDGPNGHAPGLGLALVERITRQGLHGRFRLAHEPDGPTVATVSFAAHLSVAENP